MMTPPPRRPGRPRDPSLDERALAAARELLAEVGFDGTTVQAVAARSGVHASALYRRWPSRVQLIEDAVSPSRPQAELVPSGDLRRDLRRFLRTYLAGFSDPVTRAAVPSLLAHYQRAEDGVDADRFLALSVRPQLAAILAAAPPGQVDPSVDVDDVFDVLLGAMLARALVPTIAARARPVERLVDAAVRLVSPTGA